MACRRLLHVDARECPADGAGAETVEVLPPGARLDDYRIDRVLGEGGMGFVYEATHEVLARRTAIKMLRRELAAIPQIVQRFLNEARAVNLINHQNVVDVYGYGERYGIVYFIMEFLEGETLDDLMRKRRPMAVPLVLHLFGQIARALAAAHGKQIVHRDLKPANVFVIARHANPYFIKLLDFGIAQLRGEGAVHGLTLAGSVMGTPQYMSPEQISGQGVDARTDVWAVGVMLYQAMTGVLPFGGGEFAELADQILHRPPRPAGELAAMPPALAQLIASCLERRVEDRCPSIAAMIDGLERVKRTCQLDDDAIAAAVMADAGALAEDLPGPAPAYNELAASLPEHQDARPGAGRSAARRWPRSRLARNAITGALIAGLGGTGYGMLRRAGVESGARGEAAVSRAAPAPGFAGPRLHDVANPQVDAAAALDAVGPRLAQALAAGDLTAARAIAERSLRAAITAGTPSQREAAVAALALVRGVSAVPLLYAALEGLPDVQSKAASALVELAPPEAVARLRVAYAGAGRRLNVELAAALYQLGDRGVRMALVRALEDPGSRLIAATALASMEDSAARDTLADLVAGSQVGHDSWRRALAGLARLGDGRSRALLEGELARPEAARVVGAAELLARTGHAGARDRLTQLVADPAFPRRGEAALALARLGDRSALDWAGDGLRSPDVAERTQALAIYGLTGTGAAHVPALAALAALAADGDLGVRMTVEAVVLGL